VSVDVHHVAEGPADAPVLVFGNSLGSTLEMWDPQVSRLAERSRVVRYDLRGHGRSPVPPGPYHVDALGEGVAGQPGGLGAIEALRGDVS
jgi:3-oxoadipate enol-lactonase